MPTATTYEETDYAYVRGLFDGWTPDPLPSEGWRGITEEGKKLVPDPEPSGRQGAPTIYAAWDLHYTRGIGTYEGLAAPIRYGNLMILRVQEDDGRGSGPIRLLRDALLSRLETTPAEGPLEFDLQEARSLATFYRGGWMYQLLTVPFCGD